MDIRDIFGPLASGSEVVIGQGEFNVVVGLLTQTQDLGLGLTKIDEIGSRVVPIFILNRDVNSQNPSASSFTLTLKSPMEPKFYLGTAVQPNGTQVATLSSEPTSFAVDTSSVYQSPSNNLLSGALYSLKTTSTNTTPNPTPSSNDVLFHDTTGFSEVITILPLTWFNYDNNCTEESGLPLLKERLGQRRFRAYTDASWCAQGILYCPSGSRCGDTFNGQLPQGCLGLCGGQTNCTTNANQQYYCPVDSATTSTSSSSMWWLMIIGIIIFIAIIVLGIWAVSRGRTGGVAGGNIGGSNVGGGSYFM